MNTPDPDPSRLHCLLLGQLPPDEVERLCGEYADDPRLVTYAESLGGTDRLVKLLRIHATQGIQPPEPRLERLIDRLIQAMPLPTPPVDQATTATGDQVDGATKSPPERLDQFRILGVLGEGGMGTVYRAEDTRLGRQVAVKTLRRELASNLQARDRFLREARSAAAIEHENIIPIYHVGQVDGVPFVAMPLLQGEDLAHRLRRSEGEPLPVTEVVRLGRGIAEGLAAAHARGLMHRDVKPGNVWVEESGRVKLLDFGLARTADDPRLTREGALVGTPAYMAPEQARGGQADARSDLFSLGCVLYEMATGRQPFRGTDTMAVLTSLAVDTPPPPRQLNPALPQPLSALIVRLLDKEPDARPPSAAEVARVLSRITASASLGRRARRWWPIAAAVVLVALFGWYFAPTILRVATNRGDLVIEVDDPAVEVTVKSGGAEIRDTSGGKTRTLTVCAGNDGTVEIREPGSDAVLLVEKFSLARGGKTLVRVSADRLALARKPKEIPRQPDPDAWSQRVARLPAEQQLAAVVARLRELNSGYNGKFDHRIEGDTVTELGLAADNIVDLSPVRALTGLRKLRCSDEGRGGRHADLSPLRGMHLTSLRVSGTGVSDLSPLKGMKLTELLCDHTNVKDLSPLRGMELTTLVCNFTPVADLSPLTGMKLTNLEFRNTQVADLSPLKGMKLTGVNCARTRVTDLSPLSELPLTWVNCSNTDVSSLEPLRKLALTELTFHETQVADLSPLKGMKLTSVSCRDTRVVDLSPLRGMPLRSIECTFVAERDAEILRSLTTLEKINGQPATTFWKKVTEQQ